MPRLVPERYILHSTVKYFRYISFKCKKWNNVMNIQCYYGYVVIMPCNMAECQNVIINWVLTIYDFKMQKWNIVKNIISFYVENSETV